MLSIKNYIDKVLCVGARAVVKSKDSKMLQRALTLTSTGKSPFTLELYKKFDNNHMIPRSIVSDWKVPVSDRCWETKRIFAKITLRPEQQALVGQYLHAINTHSPYGGIMQAKTGTGKTIMALKLASMINLKTLIIVPTTYLMNQWAERIRDFTDTETHEIGVIQQNQCNTEGKKFVIAMIHSLAQKEYPPTIYAEFGFVIFDEIQKLGAKTFSRVGGRFHSKYNLGLSATPRRKDGMANAFLWNIGPIVASSDKVNAMPRVIIYPYNGVEVSHNGCVWGGELSLGRYLNKLAKSTKRTYFLFKIIERLYEKGEDILVLSDRIKILDDLYVLLNEVAPNDVGMFTSKKKQPEKKIILATYGSAELGADIPRLSSLVLVTPRVDIEQSVGRVMRVEGKAATVVDIVDTASSYMVRWGKARKTRYNKMTDTIIDRVSY